MTTPRHKSSAQKRGLRKRNDGDAPKRSPRRPAEQPRSMLDFQRMFPNEAACADYMERVRWPDGFVCPSCGTKGEPYRFAAHPAILECRACKKETSLTAGTVMHKTKQPLQLWFNAAYLVTTQTPGMSALQFQRQMGISLYVTRLHGTPSGVACGHFVEGNLRCAARLPGWDHLIVLTCDDDEPNANDGCEEVSP